MRQARVEAALPILMSISASKERLSVMVEPTAELGELADSIEFAVVNANAGLKIASN